MLMTWPSLPRQVTSRRRHSWPSCGTRAAGSAWTRRGSARRAAWCPCCPVTLLCPVSTSSRPPLTPPGEDSPAAGVTGTWQSRCQVPTAPLRQVCLQALRLRPRAQASTAGDFSHLPQRPRQADPAVPQRGRSAPPALPAASGGAGADGEGRGTTDPSPAAAAGSPVMRDTIKVPEGARSELSSQPGAGPEAAGDAAGAGEAGAGGDEGAAGGHGDPPPRGAGRPLLRLRGGRNEVLHISPVPRLAPEELALWRGGHGPKRERGGKERDVEQDLGSCTPVCLFPPQARAAGAPQGWELCVRQTD